MEVIQNFLRIKNQISDLNPKTKLIAVSKGQSVDKIKLLIDSGADINQKTKEGFTPLDISKKTENNMVINNYLIEKGAISAFF